MRFQVLSSTVGYTRSGMYPEGQPILYFSVLPRDDRLMLKFSDGNQLVGVGDALDGKWGELLNLELYGTLMPQIRLTTKKLEKLLNLKMNIYMIILAVMRDICLI